MLRSVGVPHAPLSQTEEPSRPTTRPGTHSTQKLAPHRGLTVGSRSPRRSFIVLPCLMERDITLRHKVSQPPKLHGGNRPDGGASCLVADPTINEPLARV